MNAILSALLPALLQLLQTPAFQAVLNSILNDLIAKISAGVPPAAATQQAAGVAAAAAVLHLTGNPIADVQKFLAGLPIPITVPAPAAGTAGVAGLQPLLEQLLANLKSGKITLPPAPVVPASAPVAAKFP